MKNLSILFVLLVLPMLMFGQEKSIKKFYNKYKNNEDVTTVKISGTVIKLVAKFAKGEEGKEVKDVVQHISKIRLIHMQNGNLVTKRERKELLNDVRGEAFEELVRIKSDGTAVEFFVREANDKITNVLVLVSEENSFMMLSIEGTLNYKDLQNLELEMDENDTFKKLPKLRDDIPRA